MALPDDYEYGSDDAGYERGPYYSTAFQDLGIIPGATGVPFLEKDTNSAVILGNEPGRPGFTDPAGGSENYLRASRLLNLLVESVKVQHAILTEIDNLVDAGNMAPAELLLVLFRLQAISKAVS